VQEVSIRTEKHPKSAVVIWVAVVVDDEVLVRSWRGSNSRWCRDLATRGLATLEFARRRLAVRAIPASDADAVARASRKFLRKYQRATMRMWCGSPLARSAGTAPLQLWQ
jgi:hypothetical protein